jgi:hypothetical protein
MITNNKAIGGLYLAIVDKICAFEPVRGNIVSPKLDTIRSCIHHAMDLMPLKS